MSNPNKQKGTKFESDVVAVLRAAGIDARRVAQSGALDTGDVHGIEPFTGQCKAYANVADALRDGVDGVEAQRQRNGTEYGVAFVKRRMKPAGQAYAVMTLDTFAEILKRLR